MEFARKNSLMLKQLYVDQQKSTYEIADIFQTNSSKVIRALKYLGIERRKYGDAQKTALKTGRSSHPTKGKKMRAESKERISAGKAKAWKNLPQEEKDRLAKISKDNWAKMSEAEQKELRRLAAEAVREAAKEGSKTEKYVKNYLVQNNKVVRFHVKDLIPSEQLEVDLFVPALKTAIEIDGPSHFLPIWGEEKLAKHQKADMLKSGLLLANGYCLIRVKQIDKSVSTARMKEIAQAILEILEQIEQKFPKQKDRLIEIEVKDGETRYTFG